MPPSGPDAASREAIRNQFVRNEPASKETVKNQISYLPANTNLCEITEDESSLSIRNGLFMRRDFRLYPLQNSVRVALALTELCWERKLGRFYLLMPHPEHDPERSRFEAYLLFKGVPEILYTPEPWSEVDHIEWTEMNLDERLDRLQGRDWLDDWVSVLPLAVALCENEEGIAEDGKKDRPHLDGADTSLITLCIGPKVFLGPTEYMREKCGFLIETFGRKQPKDIDRPSFKPGYDTWPNLECANYHKMLEKLDGIYWKGATPYDAEPVVFYGDIVKQLVVAAREAAVIYDQPYCLSGESTQW